MQSYTGQTLYNHLINAEDGNYKKRFVYQDLENYIHTPTSKVCCLFGLRKTGKTVMINQIIRQLDNYDNVLLIICESDAPNQIYDTMQEVRMEINRHPQCKYVFIDEITKCRNFIGTASFLADDYAVSGKKVVLSGAESFCFLLAKNDELLDRCTLIHTTYIPYKEYNYLLDKDITEYIKYGGTLTDGQTFYNENAFKEYINSSIAYNLIHSLECWKQGRYFSVLQKFNDISPYELVSVINNVIEYHNRNFVASVINSRFNSHDLCPLTALLTKLSIENTSYSDDRTEIQQQIITALGINKILNVVDEKSIELITDCLKSLDVLYENNDVIKGDREFLFTQAGVRYWQSKAIVKSVLYSEEFSEYNDVEKYEILTQLDKDICGAVLEDIVFYQLSRYFEKDNNILIAKYANNYGKDIDVLVENFDTKTTLAIEVKLSEEIGEKTLKHITDEEFLKEVNDKTGTKITNKIVLYFGETSNTTERNAFYVKAHDFLCLQREDIKKLTYIPIKDSKDIDDMLS